MDEEVTAKLLAQLAALTAEVRSLKQERAPAQPTVTVAAGYVDYERAHKSTLSWTMRKYKLAPFIRRLGNLPAIEITPKVWSQHRQARRGEIIEHGNGKGRAPSEATLNVELGVGKKFLEWMTEQEYIPHNPLRPARYEIPMRKLRRKSWPRPELFAALLESPKPPGSEQRATFHGWLTLLYETGLRFSEGRWARRDRRRRTVDGWALDIDTTKGGEPHTVGMTAALLAALEAIPRVLGSPYYFARAETGKPYGATTIRTWFREACEAIGLDAHVVAGELRFRPHDLRRAAAKNLVERGGDILDAKEMLHHKSVQTTEGYVGQSVRKAVQIARIMERRGPQKTDNGNENQGPIPSPGLNIRTPNR